MRFPGGESLDSARAPGASGGRDDGCRDGARRHGGRHRARRRDRRAVQAGHRERRPFAFVHADNGSVSRLVVQADGRWLLRSFNDISHLTVTTGPAG